MQRLSLRLFVITMLLGGMDAVNGQTTFHVATTGVDAPGNGLNWERPFLTIQYALSESENDDTILVSNGTYAVTTQIVIYHNGTLSLTNTGGGTVNFSTFTPAVPGGTGNLHADPEFQDRDTRDYTLRPSSPCIDKGTNQLWMTGATDLGGDPRILMDIVDMGGYEAPEPFAGPLSCNFTASQTEGFTNLTVVFTAVVSGSDTNITYYEWDFGNGSISGANLASATNTYPAGFSACRSR